MSPLQKLQQAYLWFTKYTLQRTHISSIFRVMRVSNRSQILSAMRDDATNQLRLSVEIDMLEAKRDLITMKQRKPLSKREVARTEEMYATTIARLKEAKLEYKAKYPSAGMLSL